MFIRSQDKKCLIRFDCLFIEEIWDYDMDDINYGSVEFTICTNGGETILGIYKTELRALEILDEIQKFAINCKLVYEMPKE